MRSKAISVSPLEAERVRKRLSSEGLLLNARAIRGDEGVMFAVRDYPEWAPQHQRTEADFRMEVSGDYRKRLHAGEDILPLLPSSFDIVGTKCIIKIPAALEYMEESIGEAIMETHPSLDTVFADQGVSGPFRIRMVRKIAGTGGTETEVREYGMRFRTDVARTFYSPRLAEERRRIAGTAHGETVLDMFSGVGPFTVAMAKRGCEVVALDINPYAVSYAKENAALNGVRAEAHLADASAYGGRRFSRIIMNLPLSSSLYLGKAVELLEMEGTIDYYEQMQDSALHARIWDIQRRHGLRVVEHRRVKGYSARSSIYYLRLTPSRSAASA